MTQTVFLASYIDFGTFAAVAEDGTDIDDWSFSHEASPRVFHVFAAANEEAIDAGVEQCKAIALEDYRETYDFATHPDPEAEAELAAAIWHTGGWVKASGFQGAEPKQTGWQEWTLASPDWVAEDKQSPDPLLRLVVQQHRVF